MTSTVGFLKGWGLTALFAFGFATFCFADSDRGELMASIGAKQTKPAAHVIPARMTNPARASSPAPQPAPAPAALGGALYNSNCTICHGMAKRGSSVAKIQNAISNNTGGMGTLKHLSPSQIGAISIY